MPDPIRRNRLETTPQFKGADKEVVCTENFLAGIWPSIYWGPDQVSNQEGEIYSPPPSWRQLEGMRVPKVIRFIYDNYEHEYDDDPGGGDPPDPPDPPGPGSCNQGPWVVVHTEARIIIGLIRAIGDINRYPDGSAGAAGVRYMPEIYNHPQGQLWDIPASWLTAWNAGTPSSNPTYFFVERRNPLTGIITRMFQGNAGGYVGFYGGDYQPYSLKLYEKTIICTNSAGQQLPPRIYSTRYQYYDNDPPPEFPIEAFDANVAANTGGQVRSGHAEIPPAPGPFPGFS